MIFFISVNNILLVYERLILRDVTIMETQAEVDVIGDVECQHESFLYVITSIVDSKY